MRSAWIGAALLLAAAAVWLLQGSGGSPAGIGGGTLDEALEEEAEASARGRAPVLQSNPNARRPEVGAGDEEAALPREPQGPYRFLVISSINEKPIADVEITTDEGEVLGSTSEDGRVEFERPEEPEFVFRAVKSGFVPHRGLATTRRDVEISLAPGITIKGRVIDFETQKPVKEAVVHTFDEDLAFEVASPVTDEQGRFEMTGIRPHHPLKLIVQAAGYTPRVKLENFGEPTDDYEITIGEGGQLELRVLDLATAKPLPNVEVQLLPPGVPPAIHRGGWEPKGETEEMLIARTAVVRTDEEGRCRFRAIPLHTPFMPLALVTDRLFERGRPVHFLKADQTIEQTLRIAKASDLEVRVEDDRGDPVSGVELTLRLGNHTFPIHPKDRAGTGVWTFPGLTPGTYRVSAFRDGAPPKSDQVRVGAARTEKLRIVMPRGKPLTGRVENKRGEPIWMAKVTWLAADRSERATTKTDSKGQFALRGLVAASGTLGVSAYDIPQTRFSYEGESIENLAPGGTSLRITLRDGTRATGRFEDLPKGAAVYVAIYPGSERDHGRLWLDKEAKFERRGPQPSNYGPLFVFKTKGMAPILHFERRPFNSEETRDLGIFSFEAVNPLKGRVVDQRKRPLRGMKVEVRERWSAQFARTDADGDFEFARMPHDRDVRIKISARGYGGREWVLSRHSQYAPQLFIVKRTGTVRLLVRSVWKRPARDVEVTFFEPDPPPRAVRRIRVTKKTNAQGVLQVALPAGTYKVQIRHEQGNWTQWASETIEVRPGSFERLELQMKGGKVPKELKRRR